MSDGRILIVDGDYDILDLLATALRSRGHHVSLATDGRSGLASAVETSAEVVVVDREVSVLDVRTFIDVLRDNPRTSSAHVFVMGKGDPGHISVIHGRAEPIVKPFNPEEIAARIDEVIRTRHAPTRERELRGDLSQVSLFDLLQVFAVNRRTGKLVVEDAAGEIWLARGEIVDAAQGRAVGEKAIHRILTVRGGQFLFIPDVEHGRRRIREHVDHLLMEAARRVDEIARLEGELPPLGATIEANPVSGPPPRGLRAEILDVMTEPRTIDELVDLLEAHDLEILGAVRDLIAQGALHVLDAQSKVSFCEPDEAASFGAALLRQRRPGSVGAVRMGVIGDQPDVARFSRAMSSVREFVPSAGGAVHAGSGTFGGLGSIRLGGTELELFALPLDATLRPIWGMALAASSTVLMVGEHPPADDVEHLLRSLDLRMVYVPEAFDRAEGAVAALRDALAGRGGYAAPR